MKFASTNQKYYPDPGSDGSSVWNLCALLSDVISRVTSGSVAKCRLFSPARIVLDMIIAMIYIGLSIPVVSYVGLGGGEGGGGYYVGFMMCFLIMCLRVCLQSLSTSTMLYMER